MLRLFGLWRGSSTRVRKSLCSSFNGSAKPLMMDPMISRISAIPLKRSVSYANWKKTLLMDLLM